MINRTAVLTVVLALLLAAGSFLVPAPTVPTAKAEALAAPVSIPMDNVAADNLMGPQPNVVLAPSFSDSFSPSRQAGLACLVVGGPFAALGCELVWTGVKWAIVVAGVGTIGYIAAKNANSGDKVVGRHRVRLCQGPCTGNTNRPKCPGGFEHLCDWDANNPGRTCQRINMARSSAGQSKDTIARCYKGNAGQVGVLMTNGLFFIANGSRSTFMDIVPSNFTEAAGNKSCIAKIGLLNLWAGAAFRVAGCN